MHLFFIRHGQSANNHLWELTGTNRGRSEDPELTPTGHEQARLLAEFIQRMDEAMMVPNRRTGQMGASGMSGSANDGQEDEPARQGPLGSTVVNGLRRDYFGFTHLYTSLMVRSVLTGSYVADAIQVPLTAWVDIHETGGIYLDDEVTGEPQGLPGRTRSYFSERFANLVLPDDLAEAGWWNRPFENDLQRPERARRVLVELLQRHGGSNDRVALVSHGAFYNYFMRAIFGGDPNKTWCLMNNTGVTRVDFNEEGRAMLIYHNRTEHLPESLIT